MNPEIKIVPEDMYRALKIAKSLKENYNSLSSSISSLNLGNYPGISNFTIWKVNNAQNRFGGNIFEDIVTKLETFKNQLLEIDNSLVDLFNEIDNYNSDETFGDFEEENASEEIKFLGETIQGWNVFANGVQIVTETATMMIPNQITPFTKLHVHANGTGNGGKEEAINFYENIYNDNNNSPGLLPISIIINRPPLNSNFVEYIPIKDGNENGTEEIVDFIGAMTQKYNISYDRMVFSGYSRGCSAIMQINDTYYNKYVANQSPQVSQISSEKQSKPQLILLAQPESMIIKNEGYFNNAAAQGVEVTAIYDSDMCAIHSGSSNIYKNSQTQGTSIDVYETTYGHEELPGYAFGYDGYIGKTIFNQKLANNQTNQKLTFDENTNRYAAPNIETRTM